MISDRENQEYRETQVPGLHRPTQCFPASSAKEGLAFSFENEVLGTS